MKKTAGQILAEMMQAKARGKSTEDLRAAFIVQTEKQLDGYAHDIKVEEAKE